MKLEREISVPHIREIKTTGKYVVTVNFPRDMKKEDRPEFVNKIELYFKSFGVTNIKIIPYLNSIYEITNE